MQVTPGLPLPHDGGMIGLHKLLSHIVVMFIIISSMQSSASADISDVKTLDDGAKNERSIGEKWGIQLLSMRLSANGYMLDFRYRVKDADKASPLFSSKIQPYLVDQESGAKFLVPQPPKIGALRTTRKPIPDRNYFILFANPGKYVKPGNKVTVVIGDFRAENLVVE